MTVLNTGATKNYTQGWESIFGGKKTVKKAQAEKKTTTKKLAVKKSPKKFAGTKAKR